MSVYKVPQDVEADDKLIGPFSFRQFVFVLLMVFFVYLTYLFGTINILMAFVPIPFVIFFAALAFPWRKDQPTEVYLTALIHFWLKPRRRIWNQEGHVDHVIITVPKKVEHQYTDGLDNTEVRSRLHNLASTLDSRGWTTKNVALQDVSAEQVAQNTQNFESDRLAMPRVSAPAQDQTFTITAQDDVMDLSNNPVAQNFSNLVNKAAEDKRQALIDQMRQQAAAPTAEEPAQVNEAPNPAYQPYPQMHQNTVATSQPQQPAPTPNPPVVPDTSDAILNLANNSDLNVSTIARQAEQSLHSDETINLH